MKLGCHLHHSREQSIARWNSEAAAMKNAENDRGLDAHAMSANGDHLSEAPQQSLGKNKGICTLLGG